MEEIRNSLGKKVAEYDESSNLIVIIKDSCVTKIYLSKGISWIENDDQDRK